MQSGNTHFDKAATLDSGSAQRRSLLALGGMAMLPSRVRAQAGRQIVGKAGLLITGQSNADFFLEDGGIWIMNQGLAALLGIPEAAFDPRLNGFRTLNGYALREGFHRNPLLATTFGGTPLWAPGDKGAFLTQRTDVEPGRWNRGSSGEALDRFVRELLTNVDRRDCLGILWIHTEADTQTKRMEDVSVHTAAICRHLHLLRAAFGRPALGQHALPAYGWLPIPYGSSAEGHRAVRAALAMVAADPQNNFRLAIPQTADSEPRGGEDWSHRDAVDLRIFARRAAFAIAHHQRSLHGFPENGLPGLGPGIAGVQANSSTTTIVVVRHDQGRTLKASLAAQDGRGWSVFDSGIRRTVHGMQIVGVDRILLRHEACTRGPGRREIGYCLLGEQLGRGNAVTDGWSSQAALAGLGPEWRFDFPLQGTLIPMAALNR